MKQQKKRTTGGESARKHFAFLQALHFFSYDLRNLLTNIVGFTELLEMSAGLTQEQHNCVVQMISLTDQLMACFAPIFDSIVEDELKAVQSENPDWLVERMNALKNVTDPQRRARILTAIGQHLVVSVVSRKGSANEKAGAYTIGISERIQRAWRTRFAALGAEFLKPLPDLLHYTRLLAESDLMPSQRQYISYIDESVEALQKLMSQKIILNFYGHTAYYFDEKELSNTDSAGNKYNIGPSIGLGNRIIHGIMGYDKLARPNDEQKEGEVKDASRLSSADDALNNLRAFFFALGVPNEKIEPLLAGAALLAAEALVENRPKWDDRKKHESLRHLIVPGFVREVYRDLIDGGPRLSNGRKIWHLQLPDGHPVWQEAVRTHDPKVVVILQGYINNTPNLSDAKDLAFEKKIVRGQPGRPTGKKSGQSGRKLSTSRPT